MIPPGLPDSQLFTWAHLTSDLRLGIVSVGSAHEEENWLAKADLPFSETHELRAIRHPNKRAQSIAARRCLRLLLNNSPVEVLKGSHQEPYLPRNNGFISLAHTQGWAAAMWARYSRVGIDIEELTRPVKPEVARMFMNTQELNAYLEHLATDYYLKNWCAKEVVYKMFQPCQASVISFKHGISFQVTGEPGRCTYELHGSTGLVTRGQVYFHTHQELLVAYAAC
jgi:4'-phosphopantetheinyl transferase EntD